MTIHDASVAPGTEMPTLREWVIEWAIMIAVGVTLAALGPFGSFAIGSFGARLAYWLPATAIGYVMCRPVALVAISVAHRLDIPEIPSGILGTVFAAIPGSFAIALLGGYRVGDKANFEAFFQLYVQVALISVLVMLLFILVGRGLAKTNVSPFQPTLSAEPPRLADADEASTAPFLSRLPTAWRDGLLALEMEDHYVRAHGPGTSVLILLRMRDAEAELIGIDGFRVHRSWWVTRRAVERVLRRGRNVKLGLAGGLEAPVARDRISLLKEAGWLD